MNPGLENLKYPIGRYERPQIVTSELLRKYIDEIETLPERLRHAVEGMNESHLSTPYRPDGWTVRQVIHHIPDSHMNSYMRFKLALTEEEPTIRPYFEDKWAELPDGKMAPVEVSLQLLEMLHKRWVIMLKELTTEDLDRKFVHPEHGTRSSLDETIGMYAWHGNHHLAHITKLKERMGW